MFFNHLNLNSAYWGGKTFEEFKKGEGHHGLTEEELKQAYDLLQADFKKNPTAKEVVTIGPPPKAKAVEDKPLFQNDPNFAIK